jgi:hypothetical protein
MKYSTGSFSAGSAEYQFCIRNKIPMNAHNVYGYTFLYSAELEGETLALYKLTFGIPITIYPIVK